MQRTQDDLHAHEETQGGVKANTQKTGEWPGRWVQRAVADLAEEGVFPLVGVRSQLSKVLDKKQSMPPAPVGGGNLVPLV